MILQPRLLDEDALMLALLYFHPFGRAAAERIHTGAMRELADDALKSQQSRAGACHVRARLPFAPDAVPLRMHVPGIWLNDRSTAGRLHNHTFLATAILETSYSTGLPPPNDLDVEDALEPSLPRGLFIATSERAGWLNPPEVGNLVTQRSTLYQDATRPSDGAGSTASTAPGGYQAEGPTPLQLQALQRPADGRFDAVIESMHELVNARSHRLRRRGDAAPFDAFAARWAGVLELSGCGRSNDSALA